MGTTRRSFTDEYKTSAVSLVITDGKSIAETARNIGVHEMTLAPVFHGGGHGGVGKV